MLEKLLAAIVALTAAVEKVAAGTGGHVAATAGAAAPASVTVDQVRDKMKELIDKKGKEAVVKVLAAVNAKKLGDVKPEMLATAFAKATEELAAAPAENLFG